jgi:hypothetical protein
MMQTNERTAMILRAIAICLLPLPGLADTPLTGAEFEGLTTGKTMDHVLFGEIYGAERYFPDRRVRWAFSDDECLDGIWYEKGAMICFEYEDGTGVTLGPECWTYFRDGAEIRAISAEDDPNAPAAPVQMIPQETPLACLGPDVGV